MFFRLSSYCQRTLLVAGMTGLLTMPVWADRQQSEDAPEVRVRCQRLCSEFLELNINGSEIAQGDPRPSNASRSQSPRRHSSSNAASQRFNSPQAQQIRSKYAPRVNKLRAQIKNLRLEVAKELMQTNPNQAAIRNNVARMTELRGQQQQLLLDQLFETLKVLPASQRQEYLQPIIDHSLR